MEQEMHIARHAVRVENLVVTFAGDTVIDGLSLEIERGEKLSVTGKSGSGKTTLLKCLMGFVAPESGSVTVNGIGVSDSMTWKARRQLAWVPQSPPVIENTVEEFLKVQFSYRINSRLAFKQKEAQELFERFHLLPGVMGMRLADLSGGELQRVAIVSALLLDRNVILLDEPTSALDDKSKKAVCDYFMGLEHKTVVAVSHDKNGVYFRDNTISLEKGDAPDGS